VSVRPRYLNQYLGIMDNLDTMAARKHISLPEDQAEWVRENNINLSRFVQDAIDEQRDG